MIFQYRVKDSSGQNTGGILEAASLQQALGVLRDKGYFIITIKEKKANAEFFENFSKILAHISQSEVTDFTRQFSTMVTAGLSIIDSLDLLYNQTRNQAMRVVLGDTLGSIKGGSTLAGALQKHPEVFNKIYTALVQAGEKSGKLDVVLERLADNMEKEREFRGKIRNAMIYPIIIVSAMIAVTFIMMIFVIPKLTDIYKEFDIELPLPTKMVMGMSDFMVHFWWLVILAMFGIVSFFMSWKKTDVGIKTLDSISLRLPVWGSLMKDSMMLELTRTLGLLVGAGVSILDGLEIVADGLGSPRYGDGIREAAKKVEKGFPLGITLATNRIFPPIVGQMVTVGEETGKLDETLIRVSRFFETAADQKVKGLTTAMEPLIMVILGIGVGFLVLSMVMPMYQLTQAFN